MINLIINWILTSVLLFALSEYTSLISIDSLTTAMILALVIDILVFLLKKLSVLLKAMGCLTLGITYLIGMAVGFFALPLSLLKAMNYVGGYSIAGYREAFIVSFIMAAVGTLVLDRKKSSN